MSEDLHKLFEPLEVPDILPPNGSAVRVEVAAGALCPHTTTKHPLATGDVVTWNNYYSRLARGGALRPTGPYTPSLDETPADAWDPPEVEPAAEIDGE